MSAFIHESAHVDEGARIVGAVCRRGATLSIEETGSGASAVCGRGYLRTASGISIT